MLSKPRAKMMSCTQGTYAIAAGQSDPFSGPDVGKKGKDDYSEVSVRPGGDPAVAAGAASSPVGGDDDEESMDWWTKYFASVDAMIEVSQRDLASVRTHTGAKSEVQLSARRI